MEDNSSCGTESFQSSDSNRSVEIPKLVLGLGACTCCISSCRLFAAFLGFCFWLQVGSAFILVPYINDENEYNACSSGVTCKYFIPQQTAWHFISNASQAGSEKVMVISEDAPVRKAFVSNIDHLYLDKSNHTLYVGLYEYNTIGLSAGAFFSMIAGVVFLLGAAQVKFAKVKSSLEKDCVGKWGSVGAAFILDKVMSKAVSAAFTSMDCEEHVSNSLIYESRLSSLVVTFSMINMVMLLIACCSLVGTRFLDEGAMNMLAYCCAIVPSFGIIFCTLACVILTSSSGGNFTTSIVIGLSSIPFGCESQGDGVTVKALLVFAFFCSMLAFVITAIDAVYSVCCLRASKKQRAVSTVSDRE